MNDSHIVCAADGGMGNKYEKKDYKSALRTRCAERTRAMQLVCMCASILVPTFHRTFVSGMTWGTSMKKQISAIWHKLISYMSKEQCFLIFLYQAFTVYLENMRTGIQWRTGIGGESGRIEDLMQLSRLFQGISEYELKKSVNDFEESIVWKAIAEDSVCEAIVRELKDILKGFLQNCEDLERVITILEELAPELDGLQFTPESVNRMFAAIPVNEGTASIAEQYCGLAGTGLAVYDKLSAEGSKVNLTCEEQRMLYCDISRIRMFCHGIAAPRVLCHDILKARREEGLPGETEAGYDLVIADLPKGKNRSALVDNHEKMYREWLSIQRILDQVGDKGKAIILVTKGALVRQMEKEIRESLTEADWLEAVITIPANMYASTHLGFELLVINKWKPPEYRGKVFMADISSMKHSKTAGNGISREAVRDLQRAYTDFEDWDLFSAIVSLEEIRNKEFSWNPFLYLRFRNSEGSRKTVELGEIAEIMRGAQITKEEEKIYAEQATHYWLNIRNMEEGNISFEESSMIRAKSPDWERKFGIQEDDIIMTSKGSVLKVCIVTPDMPKAFLCGNLTRIRVDQTKYSPYVLYEFLNSEEGRNVLNSIQSGTTIKVFNNTNLSRLPVPDYENPGELQQQLKRIYQEYRMSVKEAESRFETERKKLLSNLQ